MLNNKQIEDLEYAIFRSSEFKPPSQKDNIYSLLKRKEDGTIDWTNTENVPIIRKYLNNFKEHINNLTDIVRKAENILTIVEKNK